MPDPRPETGVFKIRAVLIIVTSNALIRRDERRVDFRVFCMSRRGAMAIFASDADKGLASSHGIKTAGQSISGRMTLKTVRINVEPTRHQRLPGMGVS